MKKSSCTKLKGSRDKRADSPRYLKRREPVGESEALRDREPKLEIKHSADDRQQKVSRSMLDFLRVPSRPAQGSMGYYVAKYLDVNGENANLAPTVSGTPLFFDLHRLEPFAGSMGETPADLMRACGGLFMELTGHLESLNELRGKEHTSLFKSCVEQRLKVSKNILTLHDFAREAMDDGVDEQPTDFPYSDADLKLIVASPLEMPQRGKGFAKDDTIRHAAIHDRVENYQDILAQRKRSKIQRPPDTEKLFACLLQKNTIMAFISASEELHRHDISFDSNSVADIAEKYDALQVSLAKRNEAQAVLKRAKKNRRKSAKKYGSKSDMETEESLPKTQTVLPKSSSDQVDTGRSQQTLKKGNRRKNFSNPTSF